MSYREGDAEAAGLAEALLTRKREGARWAGMAVLYRNNFLSRGFEEALMRARIPYHLVGDVGASTLAPRSRTRWRCCALRPFPTIDSLTKLFAASSTNPAAASGRKRSRF